MINKYVSMLGLSAGVKGRSLVKMGKTLFPMLFNSRGLEQKSPQRKYEAGDPCSQYITVGKLFDGVSKKSYGSSDKISVIGLDELGITTVFSLLCQKITSNICMVDLDEDVMKGELMDLKMGALYHGNANITSTKDPAATADSKICIVITGTYKGRDEDPSTFVGRNVGIIRALIPPVLATFFMAGSHQLSGKFLRNKKDSTLVVFDNNYYVNSSC